MKKWVHKVTGLDGETMLFGVNIFEYKWENTGRKAQVRDPIYGQKYEFDISKVCIDGKEYEFATGEFSNCVYGFYVQE